MYRIHRIVFTLFIKKKGEEEKDSIKSEIHTNVE
jgi:hypothetical protein